MHERVPEGEWDPRFAVAAFPSIQLSEEMQTKLLAKKKSYDERERRKKMRTNDNLVVAAVIMSTLAIIFTLFLVIAVITSAQRDHDLDVRLMEIEQETFITLQTIDNIITIFESVGGITEELARRQLSEEIKK